MRLTGLAVSLPGTGAAVAKVEAQGIARVRCTVEITGLVDEAPAAVEVF